MKLTPEQVTAAEFAGVQFLPASPDQVHRLSMQRKVFRVGEAAVLATRNGSLFETAATLAPLIERGEQQSRDLAGWRHGEADTPAREDEAAQPPPSEPDAATDQHAESARADFIQRVKAEGEQLGIDSEALTQDASRGAQKPGRAAPGTRKVPPKYRGPNGEEWAGRGRTPRWVLAAEVEGKSRDEFLIEKPSYST